MTADLPRHGMEIDRADWRHEAGRELLAVDVPGMLEFAGHVPQALAVAGQEGIDIDDRVDPGAQPGGYAGDDHAAVGMAGEDEALEARGGDLLADVVDVIAERNARVQFGLP